MKTSEWIGEQLEHVRLIHFSMLVVCGTLFYMVLLGWSDAIEAARELDAFQHAVRSLNNLDKEPDYLAEAQPAWAAAYNRELTGKLKQYLGSGPLAMFNERDAAASSSPTVVRSISAIEPDRKLGEVLLDLQSAEWEVTEIREFLESSELTRLKKLGVDAPWFQMAPRTVVLRSVRIKNEPAGGGGRQATIALNLIYTSGGAGEGPRIQQIEKVSVEVPCVTETKKVALEKYWFATKFKHLHEHWSELEQLSFAGARKWADERRVGALVNQDPEILGLKVQGKHIGVVGPLILFAMLLYLITYLCNLHATLDTPTPQAAAGEEIVTVSRMSPWIGCMGHWTAVGMTAITLVGIPCACVYVSSWRLVGWSDLVSTCLAVAALALGVCGMVLGSMLSKHQLVEEREQK